MILSYNTPCATFQIKKPIWSGRKVGLAKYKVSEHNQIEILSANKKGIKHFPNPMYASGQLIKSCPTQITPSGVELYIVPINKLERLEREQLQPFEILDD